VALSAQCGLNNALSTYLWYFFSYHVLYSVLTSNFVHTQGATTEQLEAMLTPEKYARYKELSRASVEKVVKLGLLFRDIIEREKEGNRERERAAEGEGGVASAGAATVSSAEFEADTRESAQSEESVLSAESAATAGVQGAVLEDVTDAEISEQWEALVAQAKQKKESPPDKAAARFTCALC
jgi:hypothetical protein